MNTLKSFFLTLVIVLSSIKMYSCTRDSLRWYLGFFTSGQLFSLPVDTTSPYKTKLCYRTLGLYPKVGIQIHPGLALGLAGHLSWHWNSLQRLKPIPGLGYFARLRLLTSKPRGNFGLFLEALQVFTPAYFIHVKDWKVTRLPTPSHQFYGTLGAEIRLSKRFYLSPSMGWGWERRLRDDDLQRAEPFRYYYFANPFTLQWKL